MVGVVACADQEDRGVVARVGDWTLTEQRLAELLVLAQPFPLDSAAAEDLARLWLGGAAFAQAGSETDLLSSEEARAESTWLERREMILAQERETRLGDGIVLSPSEVERAFAGDSLRLVAQVLRRVGPETPSQERLLQQRTAERILSTLVNGGSWDAAVAESEDVATRGAAGLLGLFGPGELTPAALDRGAFRLGPGQASPVIQTAGGFHILYRPRWEDVRGLFTARLRERRLLQADQASRDQALRERSVEATPEAPRLLVEMGADPSAWLDSPETLATWTGGQLPASVVTRYLASLPNEPRAELLAAEDSVREDFVVELALRELRIGDALSSSAVDPAQLDSLLAGSHEDEMADWSRALGVEVGSPPSRDGLGRYMEAVVSRRLEARSMPAVFEVWLLAQRDHRLLPESIARAVAAAGRMITEAGREPAAGS